MYLEKSVSLRGGNGTGFSERAQNTCFMVPEAAMTRVGCLYGTNRGDFVYITVNYG